MSEEAFIRRPQSFRRKSSTFNILSGASSLFAQRGKASPVAHLDDIHGFGDFRRWFGIGEVAEQE